MKRWIGEATEPTAAEVERLQQVPLEWAEDVAACTAPLDQEVESLIRRRPEQPRRAPRLELAVGTALVLAAAVALLLLRPAPSFSIDGTGEVRLAETVSGVRVEQGDGLQRYAVERREPGADFVVRAGDVEIRVVGTRFEVEQRAGRVSVRVEEGRVEVRHDGVLAVLSAGQGWVEPVEQAAQRTTAVEVPVEPLEELEAGLQNPALVAGTPDEVSKPAAPAAATPGPAPRVEVPDAPRPARYASALDRFEAGERSTELLRTLRGLEQGPQDALTLPVQILALETEAVLAPRAAAAGLTALLAEEKRFPGRFELLVLLGDLERQADRCSAAMPYYEEATNGVSSGERGAVLLRRGLCAAALGDAAEASTLLKAGLATGTGGSLREEAERWLERAE